MPVRYRLEGVDGTHWALSGRQDPGPVRVQSVRGIGGAPFKALGQSLVRQRGWTWRGQVDEPNLITLGVKLQARPGSDAVELLKRWRRALGTGREIGRFWIVDGIEGSERYQWWRLSDRGLPDPDYAAMAACGTTFESVPLLSDDSLWRGEVTRVTSTNGAPASIRNDGDVDAWVKWTLDPGANVSIGVDEQHAVTVPAGETWTIETDPDDRYVHNQLGLDRWPLIAGYPRWRTAIRPGDTKQLNISGTGTVHAEILNQYVRGIG